MAIKNRHTVLILIVAMLHCSCEKEIKLSVVDQPPKLVVDASIENDQPPLIVLSTSLNYFGKITAKELSASFIHDAVVTVSDGTRTEHLKEYSITADTSGYIFYYYSSDSSHLTNLFTGKLNTHYTLNIQTPDKKKYDAETTIPTLAKKCDSLWWLPAPKSTGNSNLIKVMGRFTDPKGYGNYIRVFTKVNSESFYPEYTSVFDDQFVDGTTYDFQVDRSYKRNNRPDSIDSETAAYFLKGDTMTLKFCNINKTTFDFWRTWDYSQESNGNPFTSPIKVIGNISNNALGAFSGYAVQYKTLIIPK